MSILRGVLAAIAVACLAGGAWGANSIVVESKSVCTGDEGVIIGVVLSNDVSARHVTVPLEIRSTKGGAFITSLRLSWGDRMPPGRKAPLGENTFTTQFRVKDCICAKDKVKGYGEIAFSDTLAHPVTASPVGLLFSRFRMSGKELAPGKDSTGSLLMTVNIGDKAGTIEIDTTCVCPSHTPMFVYGAAPPKPVYPEFTKGVITVKSCSAGGK